MIAISLALPLRVHALIGVPTTQDKIEDPSKLTATQWLLKYVANPLIARPIIRATLTALTQQIVDWIAGNGGSNVGFVGNLEQSLQQELDARAGEFLQTVLPSVDFCGDIGAYLQLNLRSGGSLRQRAQCSLSAVVKNVQKHYDNFQNGGWQAFIRTNVDIRNNTAGAFLISYDAKLASEAARLQSFIKPYEKSSITGIKIPVKQGSTCTHRSQQYQAPDEGGLDFGKLGRNAPDTFTRREEENEQVCLTTYQEKTPGTIIEGALKKATIDTGIDFGINAKEFDEAIGTIISALTQRLITSSKGIFDSSGSPDSFAGVPGENLIPYDELSSLQGGLRQRIAGGIFAAYGAAEAQTNQTLALRAQITSAPAPLPTRELEIKQKTADLLAKKQVILNEEQLLIQTTQSSFNAIAQSDGRALDAQVSGSISRIQSLAQEVGAVPYASPSPTNDNNLKTDSLNELSGARAQIAGQITLINEVLRELTIGYNGLSALIAAKRAQVQQLQQTLEGIIDTPERQRISGEIARINGEIAAHQSDIGSLKNYYTALTNPGSSDRGLLENLQEADQEIQSSYDALASFVTISEIIGASGTALSALTDATELQKTINQTIRDAIRLLDALPIKLSGSYPPAPMPIAVPGVPPPGGGNQIPQPLPSPSPIGSDKTDLLNDVSAMRTRLANEIQLVTQHISAIDAALILAGLTKSDVTILSSYRQELTNLQQSGVGSVIKGKREQIRDLDERLQASYDRIQRTDDIDRSILITDSAGRTAASERTYATNFLFPRASDLISGTNLTLQELDDFLNTLPKSPAS